MDWIRHDLRFALRGLRRRPGVSLLAILTLAVGLGVNTVAFSAVNALVFRPFHIPGADRIGWVFAGPKNDPLAEMPIAAFEALARDARTLDAVAAEGRVALALDAQGETRQVWALAVTPRYFELVPAPVAAGRGLVATDHRADAIAAVVSERFWQRTLGATTDLASARLILNRQPVSVVGVVRDGFQGPGGLFEPDVWIPLASRRLLGLSADLDRADRGWLTVIGRPAADVPTEAIGAEAGPIVAAVTGRPAREVGAQYVRVIDGHPEARALKPAAALALGAVAVVLLIACFNVAGLLLARAAERQRDLTLAAALGASRTRLVRQLATEGLVLATCAAGAALLLAQWSAALLATFSLPAPIPQRLHFSTDWRLLAFAGGLALVAALVPTLWPAWRVWRTDLTAGARGTAANAGGGRAAARSRRAFLVLQAAGATVFLVAAAVCVRGYVTSARADLGFDTTRVALMDIDPAAYGYAPAPARATVDGVLARLRARPDFAAVSAVDHAPFFVGFPLSMEVRTSHATCTPRTCPRAMVYVADAAHIPALGLTLEAGRMFEDGAADRDAVVLSRAAADAFFPGQFPVGQAFRDGEGRVRTVTGVVADITQRAITRRDPTPVIYRPWVEADFARPITIVARARGDAAALLAPMREALRQAAPGLPPAALQTMTDRLALPLWPVRTLATFFGVCGALAVLLATVGLCGVTHQVVTQRTREFGVRMAIGASAGDVERLVLVESVRLIAPGVVIGLVAAAGLGLVARSQWLGLEPADPRVFAGALVVQFATTLLAAWWPARRAAHTNPLEALRSE